MARLKQLLSWLKSVAQALMKNEMASTVLIGLGVIFGIILVLFLCVNFVWFATVVGLLLALAVILGVAAIFGMAVKGMFDL